MQKIDIKSLVVKGNELVEAPYALTIFEQRLILILLSMIKPTDSELRSYGFMVKDLADILGLNNKNIYQEIKKVVDGLRDKDLIIYESDDSVIETKWLSSAQYFKKTGIIELCFDVKLKPYLIQLKERFTSYKLQSVIFLKSSYAIRIYELLKQYEKIRERTFAIEELKEILGVKPEEYKLYGHFKSRVIEPAQKELLDKTDIKFEYEEIKESRKVVKLKFKIQSNIKTEQLKLIPDFRANRELVDEIINITMIKENKVIEYFDIYEENYIREHLEILKAEIEKGNVDKPAGYFIDALKNDYRPKKSPYLEQQTQAKEEKKKAVSAQFESVIEAEKEAVKVAVGQAESIDITKLMPNATKKVKGTTN